MDAATILRHQVTLHSPAGERIVTVGALPAAAVAAAALVLTPRLTALAALAALAGRMSLSIGPAPAPQ